MYSVKKRCSFSIYKWSSSSLKCKTCMYYYCWFTFKTDYLHRVDLPYLWSQPLLQPGPIVTVHQIADHLHLLTVFWLVLGRKLSLWLHIWWHHCANTVITQKGNIIYCTCFINKKCFQPSHHILRGGGTFLGLILVSLGIQHKRNWVEFLTLDSLGNLWFSTAFPSRID